MQKIIGIGIDMVSIPRIEKILLKHKDAFLLKIFTPLERKLISDKKYNPSFIAKRWAAKEAAIKACSGFVKWQEIQITNSSNGAPQLQLLGSAHQEKTCLISLTDEYPYAQAKVIIVCNQT